MRDVVPSLPPGTFVVLRALAAAATATSDELEADVSAALRKLGFPRTPDSA
jgi:ribonuclease P protein component